MAPVRRTARRIRKLRKGRGLTQQALAAKAGISREYLGRLEAAKHDPTLTLLERLSKALGVNVASLLE